MDGANAQCYPTPSAALKEARAEDQIFLLPGTYEDKIFIRNLPIRMIGVGRDLVQIFSRRGGPLYLQRVPGGLISGISFRYVGSGPHSAINMFDSSCTISGCRISEGVLSGIVVYGPECRATLTQNEVCCNRESGIFVFSGARPYVAKNVCFANHHFGVAVRDRATRPDLVRNICRENMLSGMVMFQEAEAMILENVCRDNQHWGLVITPECRTSPELDELVGANTFMPNPRGALTVTEDPLAPISR